jgi:hypothetical protein
MRFSTKRRQCLLSAIMSLSLQRLVRLLDSYASARFSSFMSKNRLGPLRPLPRSTHNLVIESAVPLVKSGHSPIARVPDRGKLAAMIHRTGRRLRGVIFRPGDITSPRFRWSRRCMILHDITVAQTLAHATNRILIYS